MKRRFADSGNNIWIIFGSLYAIVAIIAVFFPSNEGRSIVYSIYVILDILLYIGLAVYYFYNRYAENKKDEHANKMLDAEGESVLTKNFSINLTRQ